MAEYITRNNAISAVCFGCNKEFSDEPCEPDACSIRKSIMALPAADVVEVKQIEIIRDDLKWWLETNTEKGVVFIPKFVVENMIAKMRGDT